MRWRGCRIRSGGMQLHGIDLFVAGPGAIKTAIWTKPTATEPKVAVEAHALGDLEAVDGAAAWGIRKARLCGPGFCFIGTLDQAAMALLSKGHVFDFQRVQFAAILRERPRLYLRRLLLRST
jgi:hypothetical protein